MRAARAALSVLFYGALGLLALAGLGLSALALYASMPGGREVVAAKLIRYADDAVAGRLELSGVTVLPRGGILVRGFRAYDPDGRLVLDVSSARLTVDVTRLRNKVVGVAAELEDASVLVEEEEGGGLSLLRAFAPAHPSPPEPEKPKEKKELFGMGGWTVRLQRLSVRGTDVWWQDRHGDTRLEVHDLSLEARAVAAPGRVRAELRLAGSLVAPVQAPVALEVRGLLDGDLARLPVLRATLGGTQLEGLGEGDLRRLTGRFALLRADVDRSEARELVGAVPPGEDLSLQAYADSDGTVVTAAAHVEPRAPGAPGAPFTPGASKGGDAAVAVRLDGARALGFDVATRELDPSALYAQAPSGRISLSAHGGAAGSSLAGLRGALELSLAPSRLRTGTLGPAQATVRLDRGSWDVPRLSVAAPGLRVQGAGRWLSGGVVSGRFSADSDDLAVAVRNLTALLAVPLPALGGRVHAEVSAAGTAAAPILTAALSAPSARLGGLSVAGLRADVEARGPFQPGQLQVTARADQVASGAQELARALSLRATVAPPEAGSTAGAQGRLSATALVLKLGKDPVLVEAAGLLARERTSLRLEALSIGYPGTRYELEAPATVLFEGPRVDRLALRAGPERIALEGGISKRALDAGLTLEKLDLARLPSGILPADEGIAGELSAEVRATGPLGTPLLVGHVAVTNGTFRAERELGVVGDVRWDLAVRRVQGKVSATLGAGKSLELEAALPVPLAGRAAEPVSATARLRDVTLDELLALGKTEAPLHGRLTAAARLQGTVGTPTLHLDASVEDGAYDDLTGLAVVATADLGKKAVVHGEGSLAGAKAVRLDAEAPLDLAELLVRPAPALRALREARLRATLEVPGLELAQVSGHLGVPADLAGTLRGTAQLSGPLAAPRGTASFTVEGGAYRGYKELSVRLQADATDAAVTARGAVRLGAQEALTVDAALRAPIERLTSRAGLRGAALALDATVPRLDLGQAASAAPLTLAGSVEGQARARGSLAHPELTLDVSGRGLSIDGKPLGDAHLTARAAGEALSATLALDPQTGGALRATLAATAPVSLDLTGEALARAPAEATLRATAVDLGFLPAVAGSFIRAASGKLEADLSAKGPLAELRPRGTVRLEGGRVAVTEYGDWTEIALDANLTDDAIELRRLQAMRGKGRVTIEGALRGLTTAQAKLDGKLTTQDLTVVRAGMDVVTLTNLEVKASGGYQARTLDVRLDVSPTTLRLPDKLPRELQSLEKRPDIIVGKKPPRKERGAAASGSAPGKGLAFKVRLVVPGRLRVVEANPRVDLEVKADVTYERSGGAEYMSGSVQVVRGDVTPISGRRFDVRRGRVTFSGGPPQAAVVDAEAVYDNPTATVTVSISGPLTRPVIKLSSSPPLDESQIAMLIATGGTELKAGGGGANVSGLQDASKIGFAVFNTLIRDRLPIDTSITIDANSEGARIGYYLPGTSVYVGLIRRFDVQATDRSRNDNEVSMQYAISPRWTLEGRWGWGGGASGSSNPNNGAASLIWSKDY